MLNDKLYNVLKWVAIVLFPSLETLWLTLGNIWGFPYTVEIGATIAAIGLFIGALIGISSVKYYAKIKEEAEAKEIENM